NPSHSVRPGSLTCTCESTSPGNRTSSAASSSTVVPARPAPNGSTAAIRPSRTPTSAAHWPSAVSTRWPRTTTPNAPDTVSVQPPGPVGAPGEPLDGGEQRGVIQRAVAVRPGRAHQLRHKCTQRNGDTGLPSRCRDDAQVLVVQFDPETRLERPIQH